MLSPGTEIFQLVTIPSFLSLGANIVLTPKIPLETTFRFLLTIFFLRNVRIGLKQTKNKQIHNGQILVFTIADDIKKSFQIEHSTQCQPSQDSATIASCTFLHSLRTKQGHSKSKTLVAMCHLNTCQSRRHRLYSLHLWRSRHHQES